MDILLLGASVFLHVVQVLFRVKQLSKSITWKPTPRLENYEWLGVWSSMGKYLEQWASPVYWNFTPAQVQNPEELVKYLENICCHSGNSREAQLTATCWGIAYTYRVLLNTVQHPQEEEKGSGSGKKVTETAATTSPGPGAAAEPENQPMTESVAARHKKKYKRKSPHSVQGEDEPGPSQEQEEEAEPVIVTGCLSLSELRDMRKDFSHHPGEQLVTWLLRCWDSGTSSVELEGREARQLGSLSREGGIGKAIGKKTQNLVSGGDSCHV